MSTRFARLLGFGLLFIFGLFSLTSVSALASVNILPAGANPSDPEDRGWFLYRLEAGQTVEDRVLLTNSSNRDITVELKGRDAEITAEGAFTVISSQLANQQAGRWIEFSSEQYTVPAAQSIEVPFQVSVPATTPSGEYGAGLAVQEIGSGGDRQAGNVTIKTRNAVRMYVTVGSELTISGEANGLNIIDPEDENFALERRTRSTLGRENLMVQFRARNTGNVFGTLRGEYEVRFPSGEVYSGTLNRDLAADNLAKVFYLDTKLPYEVGTTTATITYEITPLNATEVSAEGELSGTLQDEVTLTQEQIENFAPARSPIVVTDASEASSGAITAAPVPAPAETEERDPTRLLITIAVGLLAAILVLQVVNLVRKK